MDTRGAMRILAAAAATSLHPTAQDLTESVSTLTSCNDGIDSRPEPDPSDIQDQSLQAHDSDCTPETTFQEPVTSIQPPSPFTPQARMLQEKVQVPISTPEEASQPGESAGQGLHPGDPGLGLQHQPRTGASPPLMRQSSSKTPQETILAELKVQKAALLASLRNLPAIQVVMEEMACSDTGATGACDEPTEADIIKAANSIVKEHIKLLHEYNELKDVGQGLMGLIADQRGVRIIEVQEDFGMDAKD